MRFLVHWPEEKHPECWSSYIYWQHSKAFFADRVQTPVLREALPRLMHATKGAHPINRVSQVLHLRRSVKKPTMTGKIRKRNPMNNRIILRYGLQYGLQ